MDITYLALGSRRDDNHAGFTHPFYMSRALSSEAGVTLVLSGDSPSVSRETNPRIVELSLPSSSDRFPNPVKALESIFLARRETRDSRIVHERFRYNPIELALSGQDRYVLEINDIAGVGLSGPLERIRKYILRQKLSRCDAVITQTHTLKHHLEPLTEKPVHVVANGVDTELFTPYGGSTLRSDLGIGEDDMVVLYIGSFRPWHGLSLTLETARRFERERRKITFVLVGDGPYFERSVRSASDIESVIFTGSISPDRVPSFIAGADVCIAPFSNRDFGPIRDHGFWWCPVKLFEYMSCGKPVITMDYPEVRAIVGEAALLSEPDDLEAFTENLDTLINDASLRQTLGEAGRKRCIRNHKWSARAGELHAIYRTL